GDYSVTEDVPPGWEQTSATCDNGDDPSAITLGAGDVVTCTFNNEQDSFIVIEKTSIGSDGTFEFTSTTLPTITVTTPAGGGTASDSTASLDPGIYDFTESDPSPDFVFVSVTCDDQTGNTTVDDNTRTATIDLAAGETVTCTFVNDGVGAIKIIKKTKGDSGDFEFTVTGGASPVIETISATTPAGPGMFHSEGMTTIPLSSGTYTVAETALPSLSWKIDGNILPVCKLADGTATGTLGPITTLSGVQVEPGKTTECTFVNRAEATIEIEKIVTGSEGFFKYMFFGPEGVRDEGIQTSPAADDSFKIFVLTGQYDITEDALITTFGPLQPGWTLEDLNCFPVDQFSNPIGPNRGTYILGALPDDALDPSRGVIDLDVNTGEQIKCIFENTARGNIKIIKNTVGDDGTFGFDVTDPLGPASPIHTDIPTSGNTGMDTVQVIAGTHDVTEDDPSPNFNFVDASCEDASATPHGTPGDKTVTGIQVDVGETITCTFNNEAAGTIIVQKVTDPAGSPQVFDFTASYNAAGFSLSDGQNNNSGP
ncbi:MAG TPA: hypothetical protein VLV83_21595, partial [Acidobacteriota bacterium]|nr:hypothetical protein [Acidobacteriota bacterium]